MFSLEMSVYYFWQIEVLLGQSCIRRNGKCMKYNTYWIRNCGRYRQNACINVDLDGYRWWNDDGVNFCRRISD